MSTIQKDKEKDRKYNGFTNILFMVMQLKLVFIKLLITIFPTENLFYLQIFVFRAQQLMNTQMLVSLSL